MATIYDFPFCCTGSVICNFGESRVSEGGGFKQDYDDLKTNIQTEIKDYKQFGYAFLCATTNNKQPTANKVLRDLGFKHSKWMKKKEHPQTQVRLWWLPLMDVSATE